MQIHALARNCKVSVILNTPIYGCLNAVSITRGVNASLRRTAWAFKIRIRGCATTALGPKQTLITPNERRQCTAFSCSAASGETGADHGSSNSGLL